MQLSTVAPLSSYSPDALRQWTLTVQTKMNNLAHAADSLATCDELLATHIQAQAQTWLDQATVAKPPAVAGKLEKLRRRLKGIKTAKSAEKALDLLLQEQHQITSQICRHLVQLRYLPGQSLPERLPTELIGRIATYALADCDLVHLAQTSRHMKNLVQPSLDLRSRPYRLFTLNLQKIELASLRYGVPFSEKPTDVDHKTWQGPLYCKLDGSYIGAVVKGVKFLDHDVKDTVTMPAHVCMDAAQRLHMRFLPLTDTSTVVRIAKARSLLDLETHYTAVAQAYIDKYAITHEVTTVT